MKQKLKHISYGILTNIPGFNKYFAIAVAGIPKKENLDDAAAKSYSIWLRHMVLAKKNGLNTNPKVVAELGPGDSLGAGLAALIGGSKKYIALDIVKFANVKENLDLFDKLVSLFASRVPIPFDGKFSEIVPSLENYDFPDDIFDSERLKICLDETRIKKIRNAIISPESEQSIITYAVPWNDKTNINKNSINMIFSQAVLEHVDDLSKTCEAFKEWLSADGYMSHQIDFRCHGTANQWNGHLCYSDLTWSIMEGKRLYFINRMPISVHLEFISQENFDISYIQVGKLESKITNGDISEYFKHLIDDLEISDAFIQAEKVKKL